MKNTDIPKLSVWGFAFAAGITWALGTLILGLLSWYFHWGVEMVRVAGTVYKGFAPTLEGSLWGVVWGFADGFIGGLILAAIYNWITSCCKKK